MSERKALFKPVVDVAHRRIYCGPLAIAALTGVPLARIEKMIRRNRKGYRDDSGRRMPIKGTYPAEILDVLRRLGCKVGDRETPRMSLAKFVDNTRYVRHAYLIETPRHFIAVAGGNYCETRDGPRPIEHCKRPQRRVTQAWAIDAPTVPMYGPEDPIAPQPPVKQPRPDIKLVRAKRLADQIAAWERKKKRTETALKKLRPKLARYKRLGVI